jgi:hypothetical protein
MKQKSPRDEAFCVKIFADDLNRTRTGNAAENLSIIKHIALNTLK